MLKRSSGILVADLGASQLTCGAFRSGRGGRLVLEHLFVERLEDDLSIESLWRESVARSLRKIADDRRFRGPLSVALPAYLTLNKLMKTPLVERSKRSKIIEFEAAQVIPYPIEEVVWDYRAMGEDGTNFEILLTVAKAQSMLGFCAAVSSSGHSLTQATPSLLALYDGFQYSYPDMRESTLVVDVGARSIQLLLVENGRFVGRTLNFGGNAVTQSMADELGLEFTAAEKHKMQLLAVDRGESAPPLRLALQNGVAAFCAKLRAEIVRSTISLRQQLSVAHPTSVYVTGRAAQLPIVGQLLTEEMKVPVHRLEAIRRVDVSSAARGANADFVSVSPQLVGLASRLVTKRPMTPNLLPSVVRDELAFRRRQPALVAAAALLVTALIPPLHHFHSLAEAGQAKSAEMEAEAEPLRHIQTRMTELQRKIDEARSALADWQNVQDKKTTWLRFLADLQGRLVAVEDVWLESLSIVRPAGLKTGNPAPIEPAELRLVVSGRLLDQSNPISNVSPESYERVKRLVASIRESEFVAVVEQERFDNTQPGILRFDFTLVVQPQRSL